MFKAVSKVLVIVVMLIAFVGQALAFNTSFSCETSVDITPQNLSKPVKHFDSSRDKVNSQEDCCGIECCDIDCTCIANACSSIVYFNVTIEPSTKDTINEVVIQQQSKQPKSIATLRYRPPIFIS